jgi:hypothetical protein
MAGVGFDPPVRITDAVEVAQASGALVRRPKRRS